MLSDGLMILWRWIISAVLFASNWLRHGSSRRVRARFPIDELPVSAILAILDQLPIRQLHTLQRVNRKFRRSVNGRWLLPGRPVRTGITFFDDFHDEDDDNDDSQVWMDRGMVEIWDEQGGRLNMAVYSSTKELVYWECFGADKQKFSLSDACSQRFIDFWSSSSIRTETLMVDQTKNSSNRQRQRPAVCSPGRINVAPLLRAFRVVSSLGVVPSSNALLRKFRANYRCAADALRIYDWAGEIGDSARCRECRMEPWTENLWSCASCTSMWNGEWLTRLESNRSGPDVYLCCHVTYPKTIDILRMVELGFFPLRPQRRGMLYVVQARRVLENPPYPHPINVVGFVKSLERRIEKIYGGKMDLMDATTDGAKILQALKREKDTTHGILQFHCFFQLYVAKKHFDGGVLCAIEDPEQIQVLLVEQ